MSDLTSQYIIAQEEHNYNKKYEEGSIVKHTIDNVTTAYTAKKNVPKFISILNENYWKEIASTDKGGTVDYYNLKNKPTINGVELDGNKTSQDLGVYSKPSTGIPQSDLSSDVQSQLNKHFKGWLTAKSQLPSNPEVGDYAYVEEDGTTYIYRCSTDGEWPSTSTEEKDPVDVTFASSQEVNEVHIVDDLTTGGINDVLSAEQGKKIGETLYDYCNVTKGKYLHRHSGQTSTTIVDDENACYSEYIPITNAIGSIIWVGAGPQGSSQTQKIVELYDSNKNYINYYGNTTDPRILDLSTFTNLAFIKASFLLNSIDAGIYDSNGNPIFVVNKNNIDKLNKAEQQVNSLIKESNVIPYFRFTSLNSTFYGKSVHTNWCITKDFIEIPEGTTGITCNFGQSGAIDSYYSVLAWYSDKDDSTFITYTSNNSNPATSNVPTGAKYIKSCFKIGVPGVGIYDQDRNVIFKPNLVEDGTLEDIDKQIKQCKDINKLKEFPLTSGLVQGSYATTNWEFYGGTAAVSTECIMLVPYSGVKFKFIVPEGYAIRIHYGNIISNASQGNAISDGPFCHGDEYVIPYTYANIRFLFYNIKEGVTTVEEITKLIENGDLRILYYSLDSNTIAKNIGSERFAKAAMYKFKTPASDSYLGNIPTIGHFSDVHGDAVRLRNMMEYLEWLGVDVIVNTGDTAANKASNKMSFYHNEVAKHGIPTLVTIGNHDVWYASSALVGHTQNELSYEDVIEPNSALFDYTLPQEGEYDDEPTYYYKDLENEGLRIIVLNQYEQGLKSWDTFGRISQKQIDWFIDTLENTPNGYGVIVASHWLNDGIEYSTRIQAFCQHTSSNANIYGQNYANTVVVGRPIVTIIDAFINRDSGSGSYTQTILNNESETINYSYDFSDVDESVEFICHLNGHTHIDAIGYYRNATNPQLCINISTAQSIYGYVHFYKANDSDCPRGGQGATEDLFNVYGIDRETHTIKIARVGSDMSCDGRMRQFTIVPYNSKS